jgi:hypothetical protein
MTKRNLLAIRVCLPVGLALAFGVVACGGSDSGGDKTNTGGTSATASGGSPSTGGSTGANGAFDTGLPADKPIASLTDAEFAGLCSKFADFYSNGPAGDELKDFTCRFGGIFAAVLGGADTDAAARAACKTAYDKCVAAPSQPGVSMCTKPTGMCTATVGEFEACATDSVKAVDQLANAFPSCAELTLADLMDTGGEPTTPTESAACTTLEMKCPDGPKPPSAML